MKKVIVLCVLAYWSIAVQAECSGHSYNDIKVQEMQVNADDAIVWVQTTGTESSLNCTPQAGVFLKLDTGSVGGKNVFSTLLSTQARDSLINIRTGDNVSPCRIVYVVPK
jgi:hypothetical protein